MGITCEMCKRALEFCRPHTRTCSVTCRVAKYRMENKKTFKQRKDKRMIVKPKQRRNHKRIG